MSDERPEDRTYSEEEFAAIVRRATERPADEARRGGRRLSLEEIRVIAAEVGIDPDEVTRAARALDADRAGPLARAAGGPVIIQHVRALPGTVHREAFPRVLDTVRTLVRHQGTATEVADALEWSTEGRLNQIHLTVSPRPAGTVVTVRGDRSAAAILTITVPLAAWIIAFGATGAILEPTSAVEIGTLAGGYFIAAATAARTIWKRTGDGFRRLLAALIDEVTEEVRTEDQVG